MLASKGWWTLNVSLILIAILLFLNLFNVTLPSLGQVQYVLDREEPLCLVEWKDQWQAWTEKDSCCMEARKQLECQYQVIQTDLGRVDWKCFTGKSSVAYGLNSKAYRYCQQQDYWGR